MEHGDLKSFLTVNNQHPTFSPKMIFLIFLQKNQRTVQQLVKYMVDIAMGMHYISSRGLVHRVSMSL